jgi:hypothetical protein
MNNDIENYDRQVRVGILNLLMTALDLSLRFETFDGALERQTMLADVILLYQETLDQTEEEARASVAADPTAWLRA